MLGYLTLLVRGIAFVGFAVATTVALTHWAVKNGHLQPFGALPRAMRRLGDPLLRPLERRMLKSGANPVNAPYALFWATVAGGLLLIALTDWLIGAIITLAAGASAGPRGLLFVVVNAAFSVLIAALFIRIIASWFGVSPYSRPMRVVYALTSWLLDPLRRIIPPVGMFDLSPLVAYLLLWIARGFILRLI